jgi:hypothetical protein
MISLPSTQYRISPRLCIFPKYIENASNRECQLKNHPAQIPDAAIPGIIPEMLPEFFLTFSRGEVSQTAAALKSMKNPGFPLVPIPQVLNDGNQCALTLRFDCITAETGSILFLAKSGRTACL